MKRPLSPPATHDLLGRAFKESGAQALERMTESPLGSAPGGRYRHWDTFRHLAPPAGMTVEQAWLSVKLARRQLYQSLPLTDVDGRPFVYALPPVVLELLHRVDRDASGLIAAPEPVTNPQTQATYLLKSVVEESIRSSQLEGASTTRRVAKDMLLSGRAPRDRGERMIANNFRAMQHLRQLKSEPITPARVLELQAMLVDGTLDEPDGAGRLRHSHEHIVVADDVTGTTLHEPPPAEELPMRLRRVCDFANGTTSGAFLHPVVRAILVHLALGFDHPFVDGNGRTARALFYWVMAREGYWLCEYVSISRILRNARASYARAFLYTETDENDATYFILHQLGVLTRAIAELHAYLARKAAEIRNVDQAIRRSRTLRKDLNVRQLDLLTHALKHPSAEYTVASHQRAHTVAYATARADLHELVRKGYLEQLRRGRAHRYVMREGALRRLEKDGSA